MCKHTTYTTSTWSYAEFCNLTNFLYEEFDACTRSTRITSCFAASAARSRVMPLILRAPNTTTRFSSRSVVQLFAISFQNCTTNNLKRSEIPNLVGRGADPQILLTGAMCALIAYWKPHFLNSRSATGLHCRICVVVSINWICSRCKAI